MRRTITDLLLVILSGSLTALAFPKFNLFFLAWISLIPLLHVLSKRKPVSSFFLGLAAGSVFYAILLYWIPAVPAHYGSLSLPLSILIYLALVLVLASLWAVFGFLFSAVNRSFPVLVFFIAPFLWTSIEYIITYLFTGFPWGLIGYSQYKNIPLIQITTITGVYGIAFVMVGFQSCFLLSMKSRTKSPFFAALTLVLLIHTAGFVHVKSITPNQDSFSASVIQGNVSSDIQWAKLSYQEIEDIFNRHLDLSRSAYQEGSRLIVWPEFSVPLCFSCPYGIYQEFKERLLHFVSTTECTLLLGTNEKSEFQGETMYHNTALALKPDHTRSLYYKIHLVPFGEYTPYKKIFAFISSVAHAIGDLTPGKTHSLHAFKGIPFGSPICYEIIFPDLVRRFTKNGAQFLITITNDGWYGRSAAPFQHFSMAVLRAVENQRYLLRAATTGISGMIDPYGRILRRSELMTQTYLSETITPVRKVTIYTKYGDILPYVCLTLTVIFLILALVMRPNEKQ
ncbi:MAG: apolipoprotein N-acyltransferase [Candidatus Aminicenantes bacterium]|nr:apolipoprotein N-acyltransferase [Candidatus Aminicenantes bacterium]